jgi:hypothetical protein
MIVDEQVSFNFKIPTWGVEKEKNLRRGMECAVLDDC